MTDEDLNAHNHASGRRTKLMEEVAQQMEAIEADFGDDFEILKVLTIVMVKRPDGDAGLRIRNMDMSPLEAVGLLSMAQDVLKVQATTRQEGEDS